jgi:hypothetical protein
VYGREEDQPKFCCSRNNGNHIGNRKIRLCTVQNARNGDPDAVMCYWRR